MCRHVAFGDVRIWSSPTGVLRRPRGSQSKVAHCAPRKSALLPLAGCHGALVFVGCRVSCIQLVGPGRQAIPFLPHLPCCMLARQPLQCSAVDGTYLLAVTHLLQPRELGCDAICLGVITHHDTVASDSAATLYYSSTRGLAAEVSLQPDF